MSGVPYLASEDSALLREALRGRRGMRFLEIGAGNCGNLVEASNGFEVVVGTDIVRPAMQDWRSLGVDFVLADGAGCIRDGSFELVAFNPPYLAVEESGDRAVEGGRGLEVPMKFLREALRVVGREGSVLMLLSQEAKVEDFAEACSRAGFVLRRTGSWKGFFEELAVYEARHVASVAPPSESGGEYEADYTETSAASRRHQVPASPS
jgi:release factor glutamine methyltransferase